MGLVEINDIFYVLFLRVEKSKNGGKDTLVPIGSVEGFPKGSTGRFLATEYTNSKMSSEHAKLVVPKTPTHGHWKVKSSKDVRMAVMVDSTTPDGDGGIIVNKEEMFAYSPEGKELSRFELTVYKMRN